MKVHSFGTKSVKTAVGAYKGKPSIIIWNEKHDGEVGVPTGEVYAEMPFWKRWWIQRKATIISFDTPERAAFAAAALQSNQQIAEAIVKLFSMQK